MTRSPFIYFAISLSITNKIIYYPLKSKEHELHQHENYFQPLQTISTNQAKWLWKLQDISCILCPARILQKWYVYMVPYRNNLKSEYETAHFVYHFKFPFLLKDAGAASTWGNCFNWNRRLPQMELYTHGMGHWTLLCFFISVIWVQLTQNFTQCRTYYVDTMVQRQFSLPKDGNNFIRHSFLILGNA